MGSKSVLFHILHTPLLFFGLLFLLRAILCTMLEVHRPARKVAYRSVMWNDFGAYMTQVMLVFPVALYLTRFIPEYLPFPSIIGGLPFAVRFGLYLVISDFGRYWLHRLQHTRYLWQIHKWHHAPTYMYWLAGSRSTLQQQFVSNIPFTLAAPFLFIPPSWMALVLSVFGILMNDWMHMNVNWRTGWLEWLFVTPRFHNIHHSDNPKHYKANLGGLFTIWDRLFGTYMDPESIDSELHFGIGEKGNPVRLVLGI